MFDVSLADANRRWKHRDSSRWARHDLLELLLILLEDLTAVIAVRLFFLERSHDRRREGFAFVNRERV